VFPVRYDLNFACVFRQLDRVSELICKPIYYTFGCFCRAFLCLSRIYKFVVENKRIIDSAPSYLLSSFAKWTCPVARGLQAQSDWFQKLDPQSPVLKPPQSKGFSNAIQEPNTDDNFFAFLGYFKNF
jgi:hypothetical protein